MSAGDEQQIADAPEPTLDPMPDAGPGGPADAVEHHDPERDERPATPDQPRSAQVEEAEVPDEIEQPEELDEEEKDVDPSDEAPV